MLKIREANYLDLQSIIEIHKDRFSSFFLTSLGSAFLKVFYNAFLKSNAVLLVLEDQGKIQGFAAGSRDCRGFYKKLLSRNFLPFALQGLKIFFSKPKSLYRIAFNADKSSANQIPYAELLSIATLKNSKGYGKLLLKEFENEIAKNNPENLPVSLTTDFNDNEKAIRFYYDCGYEVLEVFESYGNRKMYRFIKKLNS